MSTDVQWSSRLTFILAGIGAAIGLGNLWRFPYVCYDNGGGAFLIPYIIALLVAGIPLWLMESAFGYRARAGVPGSFRMLIGRKTAWIGWLVVILTIILMAYYSVIMAWGVNYIGFAATLAWGSDPAGFFYNTFLRLSPDIFTLGGMNWLVVLGALISWTAVYVSIFRGIRSVEKVVWLTVLLPWAFLIVMVVRGVTLPGAFDGLSYYLTPDFAALMRPGVWVAAFGQIFYSLSIGMGIMIAYAKFLPDRHDLVRSGLLICIANGITSFVAGIAVFSTLGYLAHTTGMPVSEVVEGGIELAFVVYPAAISLLPLAPEIFGILFFVMFVTLAVDSIFAAVEGISISLQDYIAAPPVRLSAMVCVGIFLAALLFMTEGGLYWLDLVDSYYNSFAVLIVGILEAVVIGHLYGAGRLRRFMNASASRPVGRWWDVSIGYLVPAVLIVAVAANLVDRIAAPYGGYPPLAQAAGWALVAGAPIAAVAISRRFDGGPGAARDADIAAQARPADPGEPARD
ncbi:sodium-dependent transporter [Methanoculleus sp. FWC-SCC1]|uniref:Transporter n=1 Tax=Methanoculleus frigidifontis TaxID=2584085 RepID=A0ABT8M9I8_9EURY|nr:sodium-dependent transporter [Methanoculleus sp. FWC-SCC1]MDN7024585.1 sodium-dependent transporter [Methanoculleus sp. FWC-SCC1]